MSAEPAAGPWVEIEDDSGESLGLGLYSPQSQIRVRVWSFGRIPRDIPRFLEELFKVARTRRSGLLSGTDAVRYVNSEGDFMPGVILDKYADTLVLQLLTAGTDAIREMLVAAIQSVFDEPNLIEKSAGRTEEHLPDRIGTICGTGPTGPIQIRSGEDRLWVDLGGHKTGMYLDQRENVRRIRNRLEPFFTGGPVGHLLDAFCYTGAFGVGLRKLFQHVAFVEETRPALDLCRKNWESNAGLAAAAEFICEDAFRYLRQSGIGPFDAAVLDPPSFARRKGEVDGACRGYKDIFRLAMKALRPDGMLAVFCCSHHVSADLFQKVVFAASRDAGRPVQILDRLSADIDHPVSIDHPEGEYLKGLMLRVAIGT